MIEQEIKTIAGDTLFSFECDYYHTQGIKKAIMEAQKQRINQFSYCDFRGAELNRVTLRGMNFSGSDFTGTSFRGSDLRESALTNCKLDNINIRHTIGNKNEICSMQIDTYNIAFTNKYLAIGVLQYCIDEWKLFSDDTLPKSIDINWWRKWRDFIFKAIELKYD